MKVSNDIIAKITAYSLLCTMVVMLSCIAIVQQIILDSLCLAVIILLIYIFRKIRIVSYENSGGCVTIRKNHPLAFKKFISPEIELPQNYIRDYNVNDNVVLGILLLQVNSKRNKKFAVKVRLFGFSHSQREKIRSSLVSIVSQNNFDHLH